MSDEPIQRGESPDHAKLSAFGRKIQRGESPDKAKLSAFGRKHGEHDHPELPQVLLDESKRPKHPTKPMRFASLHHHSTYSYLDGFQLPEAHVRRAMELNMSAIAMTEHGNIMSHVKFEQACKDKDIGAGTVKPIFGLEAYCGEIDVERRSQTKNHLTLLAKDQEGYRNILKLVSRSWMEGFYYEPTISGSLLREHSRGLVCLSGCQGSLLFTSLVGGKNIAVEDASYERARSVAARFKRAFNGNYFIEVQAFPELATTCQANPLLARIARELKIPLVATLDCHYTVPTEREMQQVLHSVRNNGTVEEVAREWGYAADLCPPATDRALLRKLMGTGIPRDQAIAAILATEEIAQDCSVTLPHLDMVRFPVPAGCASAVELFHEWIRAGWEYRGCGRMSLADRKAYRERIAYEMSIIEEKDFVDYFLIVSDLVKFAKDADIGVGPARGSAAGSLICWLLRITEVNPMLFPQLVFERFIDITREDLPDIDLDFETDKRGAIVDYAVAKYGRDCVNQIGTFTKYKSKNALDDVARVYRIPRFKVQQIKDVLLERSSGDLRASATILDTIEQFEQAQKVVEEHPELMQATELEGNVKGFGIHAAGLAISNEPITEVVPILQREVKKRTVQVIGIDKYDAEHLGILKIDLLGLSAIDALVHMCHSLGEKAKFLYDIPIVDPVVIQGFKENDVVGIFQYEGRAMRMVNGSVKPDDFGEVCHITALARPGPLHNGAVADYVDIKRGEKTPSLMHPALDAITSFTQYQVVYQEQILRIVREIGDFDWTHAAYIRKIISRKLGDQEFNRQWERFWKGAQSIHERTDFPAIDEDMARSMWGLLTTSGSYAFNFAHSVSYGYIAWWTMWFKRHHPDIFYEAMLHRADQKSGGDSSNAKASVQSKARLDPQVIMIRDAMNSSGQFSRPSHEILPLSVTESGATWSRVPSSGSLRPGFDQIPGVGENMARTILEWRSTRPTPPTGWKSLLEVKGIGPKKFETIREFAEDPDPFKVKRLDNMIEAVKKDLPRLGLPMPTHTAIEVPYERGDDIEVVWIGVAVHKNLRDIFEVNRARTGEELDPSEVKSPELNEWMLLAGYDGTDLLSIRFTRWKYPKFKNILWKIKMNEDVLVIRGTKPGWRTAREIYVNDIWVLDPEV
jgi:DNA polymerase-3 subunit alpha